MKPVAAKAPAKAPAKKAAAKTANGTAPAKRATKSAAAKGPAKKAAAKKAGPATRAKKGDGDVDASHDVTPVEELDGAPEDIDEADLELEEIDDDEVVVVEGAATTDKAPAKVTEAGKAETEDGDDDISEPSEKDKASGDFVWDEEESEALRQARKDAELTASADSVRAYLKQIGKVALLNAEEEVELAKRIEAGLYATQKFAEFAEKGEKLTTQVRRDYQWIQRDGDRAKNHLLEANLRLVVSLAKRYTGRGMAFLDLIQEGNLGLIRAVEKFD